MRRLFRWLGLGLLGLLLLGGLAFLVAAWIYRDIPAEVLEARYANEHSRFLNIEGVRIHYRDEGNGPPVLLIHANFASLLGWDPWVAALQDKYRVIRFDMPSHGLTGPDPSGDYSLERTVYLTERLVDALGLERLTIGGTSLGGTVAIHYAARHPERVERLILLSPGALEGRDLTSPQSAHRRSVPAAANILEYILPRALPAFMLRSAWGTTRPLPESLIDRWHDMWLREGQRAAQLARLRQYESGDLEGIAARLRAPVLLLWGEANHQADVAQAYELKRMLSNAPVTLITYPGVGHMAVQEAGAEIARDVRDWLDRQVAATVD